MCISHLWSINEFHVSVQVPFPAHELAILKQQQQQNKKTEADLASLASSVSSNQITPSLDSLFSVMWKTIEDESLRAGEHLWEMHFYFVL